jgi:hypothetical protein
MQHSNSLQYATLYSVSCDSHNKHRLFPYNINGLVLTNQTAAPLHVKQAEMGGISLPIESPVLEGGEWLAPCFGRLTLRRETQYTLYRELGGPRELSGCVRETWSSPPGFEPRTVQPVASRTGYVSPFEVWTVCLYTHIMVDTGGCPSRGRHNVGTKDVQWVQFLGF